MQVVGQNRLIANYVIPSISLALILNIPKYGEILKVLPVLFLFKVYVCYFNWRFTPEEYILSKVCDYLFLNAQTERCFSRHI